MLGCAYISSSSCCSEPVRLHSTKFFLPPSTLDVTHMRKIPGSPRSLYNRKQCRPGNEARNIGYGENNSQDWNWSQDSMVPLHREMNDYKRSVCTFILHWDMNAGVSTCKDSWVLYCYLCRQCDNYNSDEWVQTKKDPNPCISKSWDAKYYSRHINRKLSM